MKLKKRIFAVLLVMLVAIGTLFALAATDYAEAVLVFSGMELTTKTTTVTDPTDSTTKEEISTQAFVDITLKNINATGVSFCLQYDTTLLQLSDVATNKEISNTSSTEGADFKYNMEHAYFEQDTTFFPDENTFKDNWDAFYLNVSPVIGVADADKGFLIMNFIPEYGSQALSDYIAADDESGEQLIMAAEEDVRFGRISFRIKSPQEFSALTDAEMAEALKIVHFSEADMTIWQGAVDEEGNLSSGDNGVQMSYWDPDAEKMVWYDDPDRYIKFEMNITAKLEKVYADKSELSVSAYDIYKTGKATDLLDFVNTNMSKLILEYADGSFVPAKMEWTEDGCNLFDIDYKATGGDYTLTHPYGEHGGVSVTVHVEPVKLKGFVAEKENLTFTTDYVQKFLAQDFTESGLTELDVLELPTVVTPVLEPYQYTGGLPDISGTFRWQDGADASGEMSAPPAGFGDSAATYTFYGIVASAQDLQEQYPWLTVADPPPTVAVTRSVVESEDDFPKTLTASATNTDGTVTITVAYNNAEDGTPNPIPENTAFFLRMPGGEDIDSALIASLGSHDGGYSVTYNADNGTYTIVLEALHTIDAEKQLAEYINLGERAGNFSIAAQETEGGPITAYADFEVLASANDYTAAPATMSSTQDYIFDYSGAYAALFPVKAGTTLPTTITLPISEIQVTTADTSVTIPQRIATTYDGTDGSEPGALATFTVESWTTTTDESTGVVTATGRLADTYYTNYGNVSNPDNINVTIKYLETADTDTESVTVEKLDDLNNFTYNPQQVGYGNGDLQTATFTVKNTGTAEIHGLSVSISLTDTDYDGFVLCTGVPEILESGASADFDIRTKKGLPVGTHVATVTLYSNNGALYTFTLTFEVVEDPVYNITLVVRTDSSFGTAVTDSGIYTAKEKELVYVTATPTDPRDYIFEGWTTSEEESEEPVTVTPGENPLKGSFEMPPKNITVYANFTEGVGALLRAEELSVTNTTESAEYELLDESWLPMEFDPIIREYRVIVPSDVNEVLLHFTPRTEAQNAEKEIIITHAEDVRAIEPVVDNGDGTWVSSSIPLFDDPPLNTLTLTMSMEETARTYTIYIYKKIPQSSLMTFEPGNGPYGLIEKAANLTDTTAAKEKFVTDGYMFTDDNCPDGETPGIVYTPKAWDNAPKNYDLEPAALFVDAGQSFADPGYSKVVNSIGEPVTAVTKSVTVNLLATADPAKWDGSSEEFVFIKSETVALPSSGTITELTGKRIRPDVYALTYSFADYDGSTVSVTKPLILLAPPGDVNIDKEADATDTSRILNRFSTDIANADNVPDYATGGLVFKYRVCDVNRDGNLNAIDANWIRAGLATTLFYMNPQEGGGGS